MEVNKQMKHYAGCIDTLDQKIKNIDRKKRLVLGYLEANEARHYSVIHDSKQGTIKISFCIELLFPFNARVCHNMNRFTGCQKNAEKIKER